MKTPQCNHAWDCIQRNVEINSPKKGDLDILVVALCRFCLAIQVTRYVTRIPPVPKRKVMKKK